MANDLDRFDAPPPAGDPRIPLAAERTLLAWIRTGLALMGFGFVVARFGLFLHELAAVRQAPMPHGGGSLWIGIALVALGIIVLVVAAARFREYSATLSTGRSSAPPGPAFALTVTLVLAVAGIAMVAYLLTVG